MHFCPKNQQPAMKDQQDCVQNVLEELGNTQLFQNRQCSTGISFLLLLLLQSILSIDCQTNEESVRIGSEDFLLFSRNELLHPLLVVLAENDEEDELLSSKLCTQRENVSLIQYQSNSFCSSEGF